MEKSEIDLLIHGNPHTTKIILATYFERFRGNWPSEAYVADLIYRRAEGSHQLLEAVNADTGTVWIREHERGMELALWTALTTVITQDREYRRLPPSRRAPASVMSGLVDKLATLPAADLAQITSYVGLLRAVVKRDPQEMPKPGPAKHP